MPDAPLLFTDVGFFPKEAVSPSSWLVNLAPGVARVCSVSTCISDGPEGWLERWRHQALGFFSSPEVARSVVSAEETDRFEIHGYRVAQWAFDEGQAVPANLEPVEVTPMPSDAVFLGYDAVGRGLSSFFECSPLSCNGGAAQFRTNAHCLLDTVEEAVHAATRFSSENWEPGIYYVVEVWRVGPAAVPMPPTPGG